MKTKSSQQIIKVKQKHYGDLELEVSKKDMISLWGDLQSDDIQCVCISRDTIPKLIKLLQDEIK